MRARLTPEEIEAQGRELIAALNARDFDAIAEMPFFDNERSEFNSAFAAAEGLVFRGLEGMREWARAVDETWDDFRVDVVRIVPAGENQAVAEFRLTGTARASGAPLDGGASQLWTFDEAGVIVRNDAWTDPRAAFEAAGVDYGPSTRSV